MPRINPIDPATATDELLPLLEIARGIFGGTPNLVTTAANAPAALESMLHQFKDTAKSSFGGAKGEQIALAVAQANGCGYCLSAHTAVGKMHGLDQATLTAARHASAPDKKTAALLVLAVDIVNTRGHLSDEQLAAARAHGITDGEILEVVAHVALNVFTNYLNNVSHTDIDFPEVAVGRAA